MIYVWIYLAVGIMVAAFVIYQFHKEGNDFLVSDLLYALLWILLWAPSLIIEIIRVHVGKLLNKKLF